MKTNIYLNNEFKAIKIILLACLLSCSSMLLKAQCNANFIDSTCNNGSVFFYNLSTGTNSFTAFSWNYGDNTTGNSIHPSHTYSANGIYTVCLTVTNFSPACNSVLCKTISVNCFSASTCQSNFGYSTCVNGSMQFFSTSTGVGNFTQYSWNFGDNTTGSGNAPSHTYTANAIYNVCLTITDTTSNCSSTICKNVNISCINTGSCQSNFGYSTCVNGSMQFFSTSTGVGNFTQYNWNYGDNTTGNGNAPSHTYTANGVYNVCLTITDTTSNCSSTICKNVNISCISSGSCTAFFNDSLCSNNSMFFYNLSSGTSSNTTYSWNFGNGGNSNQMHPSQTYTANGTYLVCLTISDSTNNCYNTYCDSVIISCVQTSIKKNVASFADAKVFPNPNAGVFHLELNNLSAEVKSVLISVYNMLGENVLLLNEKNQSSTFTKEINISNLPNGAYYLKYGDGTYFNTRKIIISK